MENDPKKRPTKATKAVNAAMLRNVRVLTIATSIDGLRNGFAVPQEGPRFARDPSEGSPQQVKSEKRFA